MEAKKKTVPVPPEFHETLNEGSLKQAESNEKELSLLTEKISATHGRCLGPRKGLPALLMLERVENALEALYERLSHVKPQFVEAKQKKKDLERLDQYKLAAAERKAAEQRLKYEQAVERAQMPIKRRAGRPPVKRMLPITVHPVDLDKLSAEQYERDRIERLLYAPEE
jgi:hypothetical protein